MIAFLPWLNRYAFDISMSFVKTIVNGNPIPYNKSSGQNVYEDTFFSTMWSFYLLLLLFQETKVSALASSPLAKLHCQDKCGIDDKLAYLPHSIEFVTDISINSFTTTVPYDPNTYSRSSGQNVKGDIFESGATTRTYFRVSLTKNKLVAIGCDIYAYVKDADSGNIVSGCASLCNDTKSINLISSSSAKSKTPYHCTGSNSRCEAAFSRPPGNVSVLIHTINTQKRMWNASNCSYILFVDKGFSNFAELLRRYLNSNCKEDKDSNLFRAEWTLDWIIGNVSCDKAIESPKYACGKHTHCITEFTNEFSAARKPRGYTCSCSPGFQGNPYLPNGCQDINECESPVVDRCPNDTQCINIPGSFFCESNSERRHVLKKQISIGTSAASSSLILVAVSFWLYRRLQQRKEKKAKQRFFKRNGGLLLQRRISLSGQSNSNNGKTLPGLKLFKKQEFEKATDNFNERRILGKGGLGTVYKGMLADGSIVAVKKSSILDEDQVSQFINEILILSQINHRHIVEISGCCLETQVPLLVYEYISNGTLASHIHRNFSAPSGSSPSITILSWEDRLRVAAEAAGALSYLHSCASSAIFHRDIKSANILLDENYRAVISDFGFSRLVPIDKTHLTTLVGGTFEYFQTGQLSHKSDVYAFGVVPAELLTSQKAVPLYKNYDQGLVKGFKSSLKQGHLLDIVDAEIIGELVKEEVILTVANLAKRCLKSKSRKRPCMKEVAIVLDQLRSTTSDVSCAYSFQDNVSIRSESSCSNSSDSQIEDDHHLKSPN